MLFSIIIPTFNRRKELSECLDCLSHYFDCDGADKNGFSIEVIVSDDAKQAELRAYLNNRYPWVRYLEGPSKGPGANRNNAAFHAMGEWLIFTDDDCRPSSDWVPRFHEFIKKSNVLEGRTMADRPKQRLDEESPINESGGYLWSCNFAIKKEVFKELGGFDDTFPYPAMEDVDFARRVIDSGEDILFCRDAIVIHPWRRVRGSKFLGKHHESELYYWRKHPVERPASLSKHYAYLAIRSLTKVTLPGLISYHGRGFRFALYRDFWLLKLSIKSLIH